VAATIAQEMAHNLGLEHVNVADDVMFPTISQVEQTFRNACLDILTPDYDDAWVCPDVHTLDCPDGRGSQQNGRAELLRVLGPRSADPVPPSIEQVEPVDGTIFELGTSIDVTARIVSATPAFGVRWTWLEGPSTPDFGPGTTRCTNRVCDLDYAPAEDGASDWPFVQLEDPVAGSYVVLLEVADTHGHYEMRTITFDVVDPDLAETGSATLGEDEPDPGCGCMWHSRAATWPLWVLLPLALPRRRGRTIAEPGPKTKHDASQATNRSMSPHQKRPTTVAPPPPGRTRGRLVHEIVAPESSPKR
jgi:hypothetical protein